MLTGPYFEDEKVGLVCGNYEVFYEESSWSRPQWTVQKPSGIIFNELLEDYHIGLLTILLRRSAYEKLSGFDSRYHVIGDFDISLRLAESWRIKTLNQTVAHFRMHGANESIKRRNLHLEELRKWSEEAKIRLPESVLPSIKSLDKLILYLEGQNAADAGDFLILLQKLQQLFPSRLFYKLIIQNIIPNPLLLSLRQLLDKNFVPTRQIFN